MPIATAARDQEHWLQNPREQMGTGRSTCVCVCVGGSSSRRVGEGSDGKAPPLPKTCLGGFFCAWRLERAFAGDAESPLRVHRSTSVKIVSRERTLNSHMGVRKVLSKIGEAAERACMMGCRVRLKRFMRQPLHPRRFLQLFFYFKLVWSITPPYIILIYSNYVRFIDREHHAWVAFDKNFPDGHGQICSLTWLVSQRSARPKNMIL